MSMDVVTHPELPAVQCREPLSIRLATTPPPTEAPALAAEPGVDEWLKNKTARFLPKIAIFIGGALIGGLVAVGAVGATATSNAASIRSLQLSTEVFREATNRSITELKDARIHWAELEQRRVTEVDRFYSQRWGPLQDTVTEQGRAIAEIATGVAEIKGMLTILANIRAPESAPR